MVRGKQKKTKYRFICSPEYMLIVAKVEPTNFIEITLYNNDKSIRSTRINLNEYTPSREKIYKLVKQFCQKFVSQGYITDDKIAQCADELSSASR